MFTFSHPSFFVRNATTAAQKPLLLVFDIYRFHPEKGGKPYMASYLVNPKDTGGQMMLDALIYIKNNYDSTLAFRRSCREGICGSCAMNIDGQNYLACLCLMVPGGEAEYARGGIRHVRVYPLPHARVKRDLIPDLQWLYTQHKNIQPWLQRREDMMKIELPEYKKKRLRAKRMENKGVKRAGYDKWSLKFVKNREFYQSVQDRELLTGLYECVLCACCSTSCPSYWWNEALYMGPAVLLQAYRWIADTRDEYATNRIARLKGEFPALRCHTIMNCSSVCPKELNPGFVVAKVKKLMHVRFGS